MDEMLEVESTPQRKTGRKPRKIEKEWLPNEIECLIHQVESQSFLWDPKHCHYKNRPKREQGFENIGELLLRSGNDCRQKWENLRAQFRSYNAKQKKQKSGQGASENYKVRWKYFEAMKFLIVVYEASTETFSNLNDDSSRSSICDLPTPSSKKQKRKADQAESNMDNDKYIAKAMSVLDKKSDSAQIFGDYVADRLRQLKEGPAEVLKEKITLLIIKALKTERNSNSDSFFN